MGKVKHHNAYKKRWAGDASIALKSKNMAKQIVVGKRNSIRLSAANEQEIFLNLFPTCHNYRIRSKKNRKLFSEPNPKMWHVVVIVHFTDPPYPFKFNLP